ncbi:MAG: hypothetical protein ACTSR1_11145, partial [Candidatus Heimdallarchaeota archaeon]
CDDIEVVLDKDEIIEVKNACQLGAVKIMGNKGGKRLYSPLIKRDGEFVEVTYEEAAEKAAQKFYLKLIIRYFMASVQQKLKHTKKV